MQKYIKHLPLAMFMAYFIKVSLFSVTYVEAVILLILGAAAAFFEFKSNDIKITELDAKVSLYEKQVEAKLKEIEAIKGQVAGLKLSSSFMSKR